MNRTRKVIRGAVAAILAIGRLFDGAISLALHFVGVVWLLEQRWIQAAFILAMASIWQIGCYGIKVRQDVEITGQPIEEKE